MTTDLLASGDRPGPAPLRWGGTPCCHGCRWHRREARRHSRTRRISGYINTCAHDAANDREIGWWSLTPKWCPVLATQEAAPHEPSPRD